MSSQTRAMISNIITKTKTAPYDSRQQVPDVPTTPNEETRELLKKLIREESEELLLALTNNPDNHAEVIKEAVDLIYVATGALAAYGYKQDEVFIDIVCRSNESKFENGVHICPETGKYLKPPSYSPPIPSIEIAVANYRASSLQHGAQCNQSQQAECN